MHRRRTVLALALVAGLVAAACSNSGSPTLTPVDDGATGQSTPTPEQTDTPTPEPTVEPTTAPTTAPPTTPTTLIPQIPGMPPVADLANIYSETAAGMISTAIADVPAYVYVPTNVAGTVTVIDQETFEIVEVFQIGGELIQHVVPSWDLTTLYASASGTNRLVPFDPTTGRPTGDEIRVDAPYNLYFTPDGAKAVVMAERLNRIDYYDPATWELLSSVPTPCDGPNHADWSVDGTFFIVTCEFSGQMARVDTLTGEIIDVLDLDAGARPQDVRLGPDGSTFYVADLAAGSLILIDAATFTVSGTIPTGAGTHSVYPSRDGTRLYVANRNAGTVSVVDPSTNTVVDEWVIPGGGSPDMGGVSADGSTFWLAGRNHDEVYAFDTATGELRARIPVPGEPHGLAVYPQPGRYSMGHTGNYR
ncbi:MAG: YncE family protein [Acidimicrobiales bacterium]